MTTTQNKAGAVLTLMVLCGWTFVFAAPHLTRKPLGVCDLIKDPNRYRNRMVTVKGRAYFGPERLSIFDRSCDGDIEINTSETEEDARKYGFLTVQDGKYCEFNDRVEDAWPVKMPPGGGCDMGLKNCGPRKFLVTATLRVLFRCNVHPEDPKPCAKVSHGNSEIVVKKVLAIEATPLPFPKDFPFPPAGEVFKRK